MGSPKTAAVSTAPEVHCYVESVGVLYFLEYLELNLKVGMVQNLGASLSAYKSKF